MDVNPISPFFSEFDGLPVHDESVFHRESDTRIQDISDVAKQSLKRTGEDNRVSKRVKRSLFNKEIDVKIVELVKAKKTFKEIAPEVGLKPHQVKYRWSTHLSLENPDISYVASKPNIFHFTKEQEQIIVERIRERKSYKEIAIELDVKAQQVMNYWTKKLSKKHTELHYDPIKIILFTEGQDQIILDLVGKRKNHNEIATVLGMKPQQVLDHWYKKLSKEHPEIHYDPIKVILFTEEQDQIIFDLVAKRKNYKEIAMELGMQTRQVANRWRILDRRGTGIKYNPIKNQKKIIYTEETDRIIVEGIKARKKYKDIAAQLKWKRIQVEYRWLTHLAQKNPGVTYKGWTAFTEAEELIILDRRLSNVPYKAIAAELNVHWEKVRRYWEKLEKLNRKAHQPKGI